MRIVMVTAEYMDQASGGLGTHVYYLSRELARRGHEVHLVTSIRKEPAQPPAPGMHLHLIPFFGGYLVRNALWTIASRRAVRALGPPDIVHAHAPLCSAYPTVHSPAVPLVTTFHTLFHYFRRIPGADVGSVLHARVGEMVDYRSLLRSDGVIAVNHSTRDEIVGLGFPGEKVDVVPNGVPWEEYSEPRPPEALDAVRKRYRFPQTEHVIVSVGVLVPRKGVDVLVEAVRQLDHTSPGKFGLLIVGDGPDRERLEGLSKPLGDRVSFAGRVPGEDLGTIYQASDLFAMPSYYEGLPTVVLEALSSGLPVLGAKIPALEGLLDGCGRLVERDPAAFAIAIRELLADPGEHARMREAAKVAASPFSWSKIAESTEKVYEAAIAASKLD